MKRKTKIAIAAAAIITVILLLPIRLTYKDGGSVEYRSPTYSITHYHRINPDSPQGYDSGWRIKVFGITVRDDLK